MNILSVYRIDRDNIGDMRSAPRLYFPFLGGDEADFSEMSRHDGERFAVVVGGGGCVDFHLFAPVVDFVGRGFGKVRVAWGCGTNSTTMVPDYRALRGYDLVGCRDWGSPFSWVPCASCMDPMFEGLRGFDPSTDVVGYFHHVRPFKNLGVPTLLNNEMDFTRVVGHLASGRVVVTNSYHGVYWATLLGRAVVMVEPWSSRFCFFRHKPTVASWDDALEAARKATCYPEALDECRKANEDFAGEVERLLGSM